MTFASERSPWQQQGVNSGVRLPNHNTNAKFERVLSDIYRDIHRFKNVIYYS